MEAKILFRRYILYTKWLGLCRPTIQSFDKWGTLKLVLSYVWFLIIHGIIWFYPIKFIVLLFNEGGNPERIIPLLAIISCFLGFAYAFSSVYFALTKHFEDFCKILDVHQQRFGILNKTTFIKRIDRLIPYFAMSFALLTSALLTAFVLHSKEDMASIAYPFDFSNLKNVVSVAVITALNEFVVMNHSILLEGLFYDMSVLFISEFAQQTKNVQNCINKFANAEVKNVTKFESSIEILRQQYISLVECFDHSNKILCHYLFGSYAAVIPGYCFMLYGITRDVLTAGETMYIAFVSLSHIALIIMFTAMGAILSIKAHAPLDALMKIDLLSVTDKTVHSVNLFVSRLTGPTIGYRVYELFTLDTNTILAVIGTLLTYTVVMLQFSGSSNINNCSLNITVN